MGSDFQDDDLKWQAVKNSETAADSVFFYAVKTTGVYCKPSCRSRLPRRDNVVFFRTGTEAIQAGYRPCQKCSPDKVPENKHMDIVINSCELIEKSEDELSLRELADRAGLSSSYFNRVFKSIVGLTPKQYYVAHRSKSVSDKFNGSSVTSAIYDAGFNSASRFYEQSKSRHGMSVTDIRQAGKGIEIRYAFSDSNLGKVLVAATDLGICAVLIGDSEEELMADIFSRFKKADFYEADDQSDFTDWVTNTVAYINDHSSFFELPLHIIGTAFQERVWRALSEIPYGQKISYSELAKQTGNPKSTRAVASACAANPLAIIVPCHRVVRSDGSLSGYRWGVERKKLLLEKEQASKRKQA